MVRNVLISDPVQVLAYSDLKQQLHRDEYAFRLVVSLRQNVLRRALSLTPICRS